VVGPVVASAADPFWSFLRFDPDDVFAFELKKKVLENRSFGKRGLYRWITYQFRQAITTKMPQTLSMYGGVWGNFCFRAAPLLQQTR
jgi:hypothetical protein